MPALHISWSANCSAFLEVLHMSQPSSIWHSRVFEYVLAITNHSFRLSKNRYSIPPAQWKYIDDLLSDVCLCFWDGGIVKRIFLGYCFQNRSPRRNKSKIPRRLPFDGTLHEGVMGWRGLLRRPWPIIIA